MPDEGDYEAPEKVKVGINMPDAPVHISEQSALLLLSMLDTVVFKGPENKMAAAVAQVEITKELQRLHPTPEPNRAQRRHPED